MIDAVRADWARLAEASGNVFSTPEWAEEWLRFTGRTPVLHLSEDRRVLVPLVVARYGPLHVARFVGHGPADELGPVCAPEDAGRAARETLALDYDVLLAEQLRADGAWAPLGGRVLRREGSPVVELEGRTWDELCGSWSPNFRQKARREPRRIERDLRATFRLATRETLDTDLDTLFRLHGARWTEKTLFLELEAFHRAFAARALERGWLRLWLLEIEDVPAAIWYGLRFGGAECYYQAGRDPAWSKYSLGFVLLVHTIRSALEDGMREYRFLRGDEEYKYRFTGRDPGLETRAVAKSALGRAALGAGVALDGVRRAARARAGRG